MRTFLNLKVKNFIEQFMWLGFSHSIGDIALQTQFISDYKPYWPMVMLAHCIIYGGCIAVALKYINRYRLWKVLFLIVGHFIIDTISSYLNNLEQYDPQIINLFDQLAHLGQLLIVYFAKHKGG